MTPQICASTILIPDLEFPVASAAFPHFTHRQSSGIATNGNHCIHEGHTSGSNRLIPSLITTAVIPITIRIRNLLFFLQTVNAKRLGPNAILVSTGNATHAIHGKAGDNTSQSLVS